MPDPKKSKEQIKKELFSNPVGGYNVDKKTTKATPAPHEVKLVKYGSGTSAKTKIIGADGKQIYDGRDSDKATKDAIRNTTKKVNDIVARRTNNADYYNNPNRKDPTTDKKNTRNFTK